MKINNILIAQNGNWSAFDDKGHPIDIPSTNLFCLWFEYLESMGHDPEQIQKISIPMNGQWFQIKPFRTENGWSFQILPES